MGSTIKLYKIPSFPKNGERLWFWQLIHCYHHVSATTWRKRKEETMKVQKSAINEYKVKKCVRWVSNITKPSVKYSWQNIHLRTQFMPGNQLTWITPVLAAEASFASLSHTAWWLGCMTLLIPRTRRRLALLLTCRETKKSWNQVISHYIFSYQPIFSA